MTADEGPFPEEVHYWDSVDMLAAGSWPDGCREGVVACTNAYEDLRTVAARLAEIPYDWSRTNEAPEREAPLPGTHPFTYSPSWSSRVRVVPAELRGRRAPDRG